MKVRLWKLERLDFMEDMSGWNVYTWTGRKKISPPPWFPTTDTRINLQKLFEPGLLENNEWSNPIQYHARMAALDYLIRLIKSKVNVKEGLILIQKTKSDGLHIDGEYFDFTEMPLCMK